MLFDKEKVKIHPLGERSERVNFKGWQKCCGCFEMVHQVQLEKSHYCCPLCGFHMRLDVRRRCELIVDPGTFEELFTEVAPSDRLQFVDLASYGERLARILKEKPGLSEAVRVGRAALQGRSIALGLFDFSFMGGSMGSVVGERLTSLIEYAKSERLPLIIVSASGGARMQESVFSLMQMAKVSAALAHLHEAKLPFISVLTDPTSGGVTASFASLGDIIIAEPGALICFTGPRVIEQVLREKVPPGFQRAEFLLEHGFIDCIVPRSELKTKLALFLDYLNPN